MKKTIMTLGAFAAIAGSSSAALYITAIVDPDVDFNARVMEIYVEGTEDLSNYDLQRAANDPVFDETFNLSGTFTDQFVYIVNDDTAFDSVFGSGFAPTIESGSMTGTGNDGFRIVLDGTNTVVDVVGEGGTNNYNDSYLYRNDNTGPDTAWIAANWTIPGNGTLDSLDEAGTAAAVPLGTFTPVPEPSSAALLGLGGLALILCRRK